MALQRVMTADRPALIVGTRGSRLALWQAEWIQAKLKALAPGLSVTLKRIQTSGDKILDVPLAKVGGKGLFVKEIEEALLRGDIDLAVHSMKDVPSVLPDGLDIVCVPEREDPRDVLLSHDGQPLSRLKREAKIGTSSLRRQAQLYQYCEDFHIHVLRGNLDTRLRKLHAGEYDAIVLAAAGLHRMGWAQEVTEYLSPDDFIPAIGQGALGLEGRQDDVFVQNMLEALNHPPTRLAVKAERALLARLEGGCQVPIGGHAVLKGNQLSLDGMVASVDGKQSVRRNIQGPVEEAERLGRDLGEWLLRSGGKQILDEIYGTA